MKWLLTAAAAILVLCIPFFVWQVQESGDVDTVIINKTVPDETYREHHGLTWLLNHWKTTEERLEADQDYYGFHPDEADASYTVTELPDDYSGTDLIYMADTYGVYEDDVAWSDHEGREGARSELLYGGLSQADWNRIEARLTDGTPSAFLAEFNSFASPTEPAVEEQVTDALGIEWTGWLGRYFDELDPEQNDEIPQWVLDAYPDWEESGPGFLLIDDRSGELIVLNEEEHLDSEGIQLTFTEAGEAYFGMESSPSYEYWFDIVTADEEDDVLAAYDWNLTEEGRQLLDEQDLPVRFDAVIHHERGASDRFYFAGDYVDIADVPRSYRYAGVEHLHRFIHALNPSANTFFWSTYVPMMDAILEDVESRAEESAEEATTSEPEDPDAPAYPSRIHEDRYEVYQDGEWQDITIQGVNMGMGRPGAFPGEAAISRDEYARWFDDISEMGANTLRIYTIHPPAFYQALEEHNEGRDDPLYLMHGSWIEEESLEETLDAFDDAHTEPFQEEMKTIVDVIHGNAEIDPEPGHADGVYNADISDYVIGWIIGIEWYPFMVLETNETYSGLGDYEGEYVYTEGAEPFEHWLAEQMDVLVSYEAETYDAYRPVSFTNWVTTDLLEHPAEPDEEEDLVGVDPNVIHLQGDMDNAGQFASYHVYPYYPDFLNYEERYLNFPDRNGEPNNYAGYLHDLHEAHDMPVLIAEFGVPSSRGLTHVNPFGWNQGFHSEEAQGEIVSDLYLDILHEGMLGGLVFTWQDEWFKRTWNTMDYDNPDRRPFWSNDQTNEEQFGLLSFDRNKVRINEDPDDGSWDEAETLYTADDGPLQQVQMDHDERYLYLRLDLEEDVWEEGLHPKVLFQTNPDQGNETIADVDGVSFDEGMDFMMTLQSEEEAYVEVDRYYDVFENDYSHETDVFPEDLAPPENNSGDFSPIRLALNQELVIPSRDLTVPFTYYETGELLHGIGDPDHDAYNSLADFYYNDEEHVIEVRLPWLLLQFRDPSMREVMADIYDEDGDAGTFIDGIQTAVLLVEEDSGSYEVQASLPERDDDVISDMSLYEWETWDEPAYEERLKDSYYLLQDTFLEQLEETEE
ncbi:hypothetical protein [Alkalicoccus chagannorensis]|uniref:hypothetical protein n=1 Tax=Alkalicoccus chagannorensis TaxID=427072 RepID=UPI000405C5E5|nr:hypothetical protein [Alkalicoccus chagannorensis]